MAGLRLDAARTTAWSSGLLLATDVAEYLVARGMPFRVAHETVGAMVRRLAAEGRDFQSLSAAEWAAFSPLFQPDVVAGDHAGGGGRRPADAAVHEPGGGGVGRWRRRGRGWRRALEPSCSVLYSYADASSEAGEE